MSGVSKEIGSEQIPKSTIAALGKMPGSEGNHGQTAKHRQYCVNVARLGMSGVVHLDGCHGNISHCYLQQCCTVNAAARQLMGQQVRKRKVAQGGWLLTMTSANSVWAHANEEEYPIANGVLRRWGNTRGSLKRLLCLM